MAADEVVDTRKIEFSTEEVSTIAPRRGKGVPHAVRLCQQQTETAQ